MFERDEVLSIIKDEERTRRKQFSANSGIQKNKGNNRTPSFSVWMDGGILQEFHDKTGLLLRYSDAYQNWFCLLKTDEDVKRAEAWEEKRGTRVYIRNCLPATVALNLNFVDNESGNKTPHGKAEEAAKHHRNEHAIEAIASELVDACSDICWLRDSDLICAVPAAATKDWDLPKVLASRLAERLAKPDVTSSITVESKRSVKESELTKKWDTWSEAKISVNSEILRGKRVILLDDKYQSGVTMQFVAKLLLESGAAEVHGLAVVKTLRDTDNNPRADDDLVE